MPTSNLGSKHKAWREKNPLRVWRKEQGLSMMNASAVIGCGISTLQAWEYGSTQPQFDVVASHMGVTATTLKRNWSAWTSKRPKA